MASTCGSLSAAGWYSDGTFRRPWNGTSFTGACSNCSTCLIGDTVITLSDGSTKLIQDIQINDILKSVYVDGMPEYSYQWPDWSSTTLNYRDSMVKVLDIQSYVTDTVIDINNGRLIATDTHNHIVKKDGVWYIRNTSELNVGDILLDMDNCEFEITSLVIINELITVYDMDVSNSNLYFANNVLTHNKSGGGPGFSVGP
jgi:hypothetical protein